MSTFCGRMAEIDYISIDNFTGENLKSKAFFLSHCHWDHMDGIDNMAFEAALLKNNANLYVSSVSKAILEKMFPNMNLKIKVLDMNGKNLIDIPDMDKILTVTLIPAGHCPGSVMFLFESDKTLLYTGDIRIRVNELKKYKELYDSTGKLKRIDNIYLDTTFFLKCYEYFPLRDESIDKFCVLINDWLRKDENNFVAIETPANYGSEYLFIEIFKRCKQPIHVTKKKYDIYINFPEMDNAITLNGLKTRIHNECLGRNNCATICNKIEFLNKHRLNIKPSALFWRNYDFKNGIVEERSKTYHVCYSSHSSYTEIMDILKFLKPLTITPNVVQKKENDNNEMMATIKDILEEMHKEGSTETEDSEEYFKNKTNWINNDNHIKNCKEDSNDENNDFFDFLESPDSKRKKFDV